MIIENGNEYIYEYLMIINTYYLNDCNVVKD